MVETVPAQGAVAQEVKGAVLIRFDETLSERGPRVGEEVSVSPETGEVKVDRSGRELKVSIAGGWQKGLVYHVTVLPGWQDRHGNARAVPYDLIFSTGPEIIPTALGGLITDRLTGRPVANARVLATSVRDSTVYTTLTDTAGFFVLQSLPIGGYQTTVFIDMNRDRKLDFREPRAAVTRAISTARDTQIVELALLAPDTTPARLLRADARDTMQVRVAFDDFIDAAEPLGAVSVSLWQLPDSTRGPNASLMHIREYEMRQRAARDTTANAQPARPDTTRAYPTQELVLVPAQPLLPKTRYRVIVSGIRNVVGLPNGGGTATFETAARPKPAPAPTDTIKRAPLDTLKRAPKDTIKH